MSSSRAMTCCSASRPEGAASASRETSHGSSCIVNGPNVHVLSGCDAPSILGEPGLRAVELVLCVGPSPMVAKSPSSAGATLATPARTRVRSRRMPGA